MYILGINGIEGLFHDASATLVNNGIIVASVEEERFTRRKHSGGIPYKSIEYCLKRAKISFEDVDHIGFYLQPDVLRDTFVFQFAKEWPNSTKKLRYYLDGADQIERVEQSLLNYFSPKNFPTFHYLNHHLTHAACAYYTSGFQNAAILTLDGSGDRETASLFAGRGHSLKRVHDYLIYPESLGYLYTVISAHLGLGWIEGPGKLMGLAAYGKPDQSIWENIIHFSEDPNKPIRIDCSFFDYHLGGQGLSEKGREFFCPPRGKEEDLRIEHFNLASSTQDLLRRAVVHIAKTIPHHIPNEKHLCYSGGIALNLGTNRDLYNIDWVRKFHIPPPANDGGTSMGAALYLSALQSTSTVTLDFTPYLGPDIGEFDIISTLNNINASLTWKYLEDQDLFSATAGILHQGGIVGWVQGRMECGPRALGNRSIIANPTFVNTKNEVNRRVKHREDFRPYAPSVLAEHMEQWFDIAESPYMLLEANVFAEKRTAIPAVVHVDNTSRPHSVRKVDNPKYYNMIAAFYELSGVPLVLNTSFNQHGEPIVNTPTEALNVLISTDMDALIWGNYLICK